MSLEANNINPLPSVRADSQPTATNNYSHAFEQESSEGLTDRIRRFGFSIGSTNFLVQEGVYCELLVDLSITPIPNAPKHFSGLMNLRGNIVPIYSFSAFINRERPAPSYAYLIGTAAEGAALLIDNKPKLVDITGISPDKQQSELPEQLNSCVNGCYKIEGRSWLALDHEALFSKMTLPV